jgi:hypothetical protein
MAAYLMPQGKQQYFSTAGAPLVGGKVWTYQAGSTTPLATYSDAAGAIPNANPVILDSRGEASIFFSAAAYKVALQDSTGASIWTQDNLVVYAGADTVNYTPAGTGAVATTVQSKLRESVSVKDFGADATGVTDSTSAFLAAATASLSVFIPAGTYKLTSGSLSFSTGVAFIGAGQGAVTLNCASGTSNLFSWTGSATGGGMSGVTINGSGMTGGNLISNIGQSRWTIRDCILLGGYNGVYIQDQNVATLSNVYFNNQVGAYSIKNYGNGTQAANVLDINNVQIGFATNISSSPTGIIIDGDAATIDMRHVAVVKGYRGISIVNTPNFALGPTFLSAYDFQADFPYDSGIYIDGGTGQTQTHHFTDAYAAGSIAGDGIYINTSARYVTIKGAQISGNYKRGIYSNGRYVKISSCQIADNSKAGSASYAGLTLGATTIGASVSNNLIGQWVGYALSLQSYGVEIIAGATGYCVTNNNLLLNVTGEYIDNAASGDAVIFGNVQSSGKANIINSPIQNPTGDLQLLGAGTANAAKLGNSQGTGFAATASDAATVNFLKAFGHAAGVSPAMQAVGSDTNIDLTLLSKGTGTIQFGSAAMYAANGAVATSLGSVGPTGSRTTVQKWFAIKDNSGSLFYIPCW